MDIAHAQEWPLSRGKVASCTNEMAGTSSSPICIDPSSSPGSGCENLTLSPAKSPLKVVKLRGQEYR